MPTIDQPAMRFVRMSPNLLNEDIERPTIESVEVKIFSPARSIIDAFRQERLVGRNLAIESLREALRRRQATPGDIANMAERRGVWTKIRPYLEAMTADA
ncbi:MAG TPA: transcriptional regulator, partial [Caulobacteraceae bacterium]|jgi:hypothetical protein|nr:transcriptional regulator [Caulobacteraceae bacterium]